MQIPCQFLNVKNIHCTQASHKGMTAKTRNFIVIKFNEYCDFFIKFYWRKLLQGWCFLPNILSNFSHTLGRKSHRHAKKIQLLKSIIVLYIPYFSLTGGNAYRSCIQRFDDVILFSNQPACNYGYPCFVVDCPDYLRHYAR